jgi:hypothetical protein
MIFTRWDAHAPKNQDSEPINGGIRSGVCAGDFVN